MQPLILFYLIVIYLINVIYPVDSLIHFDNKTIHRHVCFYGDETYPRMIDSSTAKDGEEPVTYFLSGSDAVNRIGHGQTESSPPFLSINASTGDIYLNENVVNVSHTDITLMKYGQGARGNTTKLEISLTLEQARIFNETCPKALHFEARQIAPLGEEIGIVTCDERTSFNASRVTTSYKTVLVSQGNYVPFNITQSGVIVVSDRLVFHNSIRDITIFNVLLINDITDDVIFNCTRISTSITTVITVKQAECKGNWTYNLTQNMFLYVPAMVTFPTSSSVSECMSNCTDRKSPQCNSIIYNVLTNMCYIHNETHRTKPNDTRARMGYFYYRKNCETAALADIRLRTLEEKISQTHTGGGRLAALKDLTSVVLHVRNSQSDVEKAIDIFEDLVNRNLDIQDFQDFFKTASECLELLIGIVGERDVNAQILFRLFEIFDELLASANQATGITRNYLEISGNLTSSILVNRTKTAKSTNKLILRVFDGQSAVIFRKFPTDCFVGIGVLTGFEASIMPASPANKTSIHDNEYRNYYLASHIVSITSDPYPQHQIDVELHVKTNMNVSYIIEDQLCVFLSSNETFSRNYVWDTTGCTLLGSNQTHTRCLCNHMTNFAVLMQVKEFKLSPIHKISLEVVTKVGCCVSIAALTTSLVVLMWLRLQSDRYMLLMNLMAAIILAQVVFLTGIDAVGNKVVCRLVAIILHYVYLTVFTLMLAQGFHLYQKLFRAFASDTSLSMFLFLGWGSPVAIIAISLITNLQGYGTDERCWLSTDGPVWAFVGPALTVISINMAILVMIIRTFLGVKFNANKTDVDKFKASVRATVILLPLLGITWMFGIAAVNGSTVVFQYVFAILNSLQGLFIFLFHVVFNEEVKDACGKYKGRVITLLSNMTPRVVGRDIPSRNQKDTHRRRQSQKPQGNRKDS